MHDELAGASQTGISMNRAMQCDTVWAAPVSMLNNEFGH